MAERKTTLQLDRRIKRFHIWCHNQVWYGPENVSNYIMTVICKVIVYLVK